MVRGEVWRHPDHMNPNSSPASRPSRLTRSTTDKKIGGVAGGLAAYFNVDPLLVRISFAVTSLFSGIGLIAYILVLAFVPSDDAAPSGAHPAAA
jgi:phage shock protein C